LPPTAVAQADLNAAVWRTGRLLSEYDNRRLEPAEVLILSRYREAFTGRVLDVGCGAGRILGYLIQLGADAHGVDISSAMVEHCRRQFPGVDIQVGDLAALSATVTAPFDVVLLSDNVLDVFDDADRRTVLAGVRSLLAPEGLAVFSSHNLAHWEGAPDSAAAPSPPRSSRLAFVARKLASRSVLWMLNAIVRLPRRRANRRRLAPLQYRATDHAVVNDAAHDYGLLHYYIRAADQQRQLEELGFVLQECLEFEGAIVPSGHDGAGPSLYYIASAR
jgi:SAM-dependent methyltransferase